MSLPRERDIELPLLRALVELGGEARPRDVYPLVTKAFPELTEADLAERTEAGAPRWTNRIQWVRQNLTERGEMTSPRWGVWAITEKGRQRLAGKLPDGPRAQPPLSIMELYEEYQRTFKKSLIGRLQDMAPADFERFARRLLEVYGFQDLKVTAVSRDGGLDGFGRLKVGLAMMNVAFQCKRWQGPVGRPEVDKFRGAIQGEFEQGIFFTTSDFTREAREASIKKGAVPIVLLNGEAIAELMIERGLGVIRRPLTLYVDAVDTLSSEAQ